MIVGAGDRINVSGPLQFLYADPHKEVSCCSRRAAKRAGEKTASCPIKSEPLQILQQNAELKAKGKRWLFHLEFKEGGAQGLQFDTESGELYCQIPDNFEITPQAEMPLTVNIDGNPVETGTCSVNETGRLIVKFNENVFVRRRRICSGRSAVAFQKMKFP